jgi:hypothetical protein
MAERAVVVDTELQHHTLSVRISCSISFLSSCVVRASQEIFLLILRGAGFARLQGQYLGVVAPIRLGEATTASSAWRSSRREKGPAATFVADG